MSVLYFNLRVHHFCIVILSMPVEECASMVSWIMWHIIFLPRYQAAMWLTFFLFKPCFVPLQQLHFRKRLILFFFYRIPDLCFHVFVGSSDDREPDVLNSWCADDEPVLKALYHTRCFNPSSPMWSSEAGFSIDSTTMDTLQSPESWPGEHVIMESRYKTWRQH